MKIRYLKKAVAFLENLAPALYGKEIYFSYLHEAKEYVKDLYEKIEEEIPKQTHKPAPPHFDKFGKDISYITIRKNRRTQWYVFFKTTQKDGELTYKIRYVTNNHVSAQYFPGDKLL